MDQPYSFIHWYLPSLADLIFSANQPPVPPKYQFENVVCCIYFLTLLTILTNVGVRGLSKKLVELVNKNKSTSAVALSFLHV